MAAVVVPFPVARRVAHVRKAAAFMARGSTLQAEAHLRVQSEKLAETLARKGVDPALIEAEVTSYRAAVAAALWRAVLLPGSGGAA